MLHRCHGLGDIECFFSPIFQNFVVKVLKMKWNSQGVIHPHTCQGELSGQGGIWMFKEDIYAKYPQKIWFTLNVINALKSKP
jgi:hypothetical protein